MSDDTIEIKPNKFLEGLAAARSHIVFIIGLLCATFLVLLLEYWDGELVLGERIKIELSKDVELAEHRQLNDTEREYAEIAWQYFKNNYVEETGLVNSVDGYTETTMWDTASYMMAVISAQRLGLIDNTTFDQRITKVMETLSTMPLFDDKLPNKAYDTETLQMVDHQTKEVGGTGWSALDIGRIMVPMNILLWNYPQHNGRVQRLLNYWDLSALLEEGLIKSAKLEEGEVVKTQEGRIGYEEYSAKSFLLMGHDVTEALRYDDFLKEIDIYGVKVPTDRRRPNKYLAHNYVVSEPYILDGLEFGFDRVSKEFAFRVFAAQEQRFKETGQLTAVSEDNLDRYPFFVYNTVYSSGKKWNAITENGEDASQHKTISTKAAFGWHALYGSDYTEQLVANVQDLYNKEIGWYSGRYELDNKPNTVITANTNGIILTSLAYKQFGKMVNVYPSGAADKEEYAFKN